MNQRPMGITILAVLSAIGGIFSILGGLALFGLGALGVAAGSAALGGLATIFGAVTLVVGVLYLALAYGFWALKPWGWTLGLGLAAFSLVWVGVTAVMSGDITGTLTGSIVTIVISVVIIYYLLQPKIKAAFGRA